MILDRDWSDHPLGHPKGWSAELRSALSLILNSPESMILAWGPDLSFFFNETYFPLLGPRLGWAMGERFDKVWADGWEQAKPIIDEAFAGRSKRFVDLPWILATDRGSQETWWTFSYSRVLASDGSVAGLFILTNETTGRVLADKALTDSQAELQTLNQTLERRVEERTAERDLIWDTAPELMAAVDFAGVLRRVNPAWTSLLGYTPAELINHHVNEFIVADDHAETVEAYQTAARGGLPRIVNRYRHKDGSLRWVSWVAAPNNGIIYATGRDVTEERQRTLALQQAEEALRQSQKMEAVGQLTGGIAHDFNNLLAGISGSIEMVQSRLKDNRIGEIESYLTAAQGAARKAAALTHRLLAFSRRQTLDARATSIVSLVRDMEDLIQRTVGPAIAVTSAADADAWNVLIDPNQLENALLNLCINARDAMPDGGNLRIEVSNIWLEAAEASEQDLPAGPYVAMCVADDGVGMSADVVSKAFDPFFTTKPIGVGTGLGLSMIYGFARQSGGQVRIQSVVNQGTMVCVYLPRHLGEAVQEPSRAQVEAVPPVADGQMVLVIDDEPLVRMIVVEALEELGYGVLEAEDGPQGMEIVRSNAQIDLLITDVGLPNGMNGRQVADAARELRPGLKVLFVTGYAENAVLNHGDLEPGMGVVTKPFVIDDLARRIHGMFAAN